MHVIRRQVLDFTIDNSVDYFGMPEKIRALYWDKILPGIDEVFSKLAPEDTVYRFDKLEIDLGVLPLEMLETQLAGQVEKNLRKTIREALLFGNNNGGNGRPITHSTRKPAEKTEWLIHFLQTGLLPWYAASVAGTPNSLLRKVLHVDPSDLISFLRRRAGQGHIERLVQQCSAATLEELLKAAGQGIPWRQLRADFRKINGALTQKSENAHQRTTVFHRWALTALLRNHAIGEVKIDELIGAFSRLAGVNLQQMITGIKATFSSKAPESALLRDFLKTAEHKGKAMSARTKGEGEKVTPGQSTTDSLTRPDAPRQEGTGGGPTLPVSSISEKNLLEAALNEGIFIENAGLVLLAPFFRSLYEKAGLLQGNRFLSERSQERAVLLSQYAVHGQRRYDEPRLLLNKILCGWPPEKSLASRFRPNAREKRAVVELIDSVIAHWTALGNISAAGFCHTFLIRQGKLVFQDEQFNLLVERKAFDLLLEKLPWNISLLRSAWMQHPLWVEW